LTIGGDFDHGLRG